MTESKRNGLMGEFTQHLNEENNRRAEIVRASKGEEVEVVKMGEFDYTPRYISA
jgi:hypothetical protein